MLEHLSNEALVLQSMRVLAEGAAKLYEHDAQPLYRLGQENKDNNAIAAFDAMGVTLTSLQQNAIEMQQAHNRMPRRINTAGIRQNMLKRRFPHKYLSKKPLFACFTIVDDAAHATNSTILR